jgi:hypothetical protein
MMKFSPGKKGRGSFTDIIDKHRQMIKTRPKALPNRDYGCGWGRVYVGYLLVGKLVGEPAPTKFIASGLFHQKNIYLCQSPSAFICVYLRFQKKPDYMVEAGSPSDATKQRDWKTRPYSALFT